MAKGELTLEFDEQDLKRIYKALDRLDQIQRDAMVLKGFQEAARLVKRKGQAALRSTMSKDPWNVEMRQRMAAQRGGSLVNSIGIKTIKKKGKVHIGFKKLGHHAHLVNFGTVKRYKKTTGQYTGSVSKNAPNVGSMFWSNNLSRNEQAIKQKIINSVIASCKKMGWK